MTSLAAAGATTKLKRRMQIQSAGMIEAQVTEMICNIITQECAMSSPCGIMRRREGELDGRRVLAADGNFARQSRGNLPASWCCADGSAAPGARHDPRRRGTDRCL